MNIKCYLVGLISGIILAILAMILWGKSDKIDLVSETFSVQKNNQEIQHPTNTLKVNKDSVIFKYDIPSEHYGLISGALSVPRSSFLYKHSLSFGAVALNNSALARVAYSYKKIELSAYLGYNFQLRTPAYGFGLGAKWNF
ncbi:MAG: hypothetical protein ACRC9L_02135 [Brevinema sp.]